MANVRASGIGQHIDNAGFTFGRGNKNNRMRDSGGGYNRSNSTRGGGFSYHRNTIPNVNNHAQFHFQHNSQSSLQKQCVSSQSALQHLPDDGGHFWINNSTAALCITQYFLNNTVTVKTADGRCYEGILQGCVSQNQLCFSHVVELSTKVNGLERLVNQATSKTMCIPMADIVFMKAKAVSEDEVLISNGISNSPSMVMVKDNFTDEGIRNRVTVSAVDNYQSDCHLQEYDLEADENGMVVEDMTIESIGGTESRWSAESMFLAPPNRLIGESTSDFDATFETKYSSVQINITEDFAKRLKRAEQLSREITASSPSNSYLELENLEDEEARFSAVQCTDRFSERVVGTTNNPRAGSVPPIRPLPLHQSDFKTPILEEVPERSLKNLENLKISSFEQQNGSLKEKKNFSSKRQQKTQQTQQSINKVAPMSVVTTEIVPTSPNSANSSLNSEGTPLSNLNPDAFEFKPRKKTNTSAVIISMPDAANQQQSALLTQQTYSSITSAPPHVVHNQTHATPQQIMVIPHHSGGPSHQVGAHGQSTQHAGLTAPTQGPIAVYPQLLSYTPSHGAHGVFTQGVPHSLMYIVPVHHSQQHHLLTGSQVTSVAQSGQQHPASAGKAVIHSSGNNIGSGGVQKSSIATFRQQPVVINTGPNGASGPPNQSLAQQMMVTGPPIMMTAQHAQYYHYQPQHQHQLLRHPSQLQQQLPTHDPASLHSLYEQQQQQQQLEALHRQQQMQGHGQTQPVSLVSGLSSTSTGSIAQQHQVAPSPPISTPQGIIFPVGAHPIQWNAIAAHQVQWSNASHYCPTIHYQTSHQHQQLPSHINVPQQHYHHSCVPPPSYGIIHSGCNALPHPQVAFQASEQTSLP